MAEHYEKVIATDVSKPQLDLAFQLPNVTYALTDQRMTEDQVRTLVGDEGSVDLVICAQSMHWFDLENFHTHVRRVLRKPGGVIAAWTYTAPSLSPAVDTVLASFLDKISGDWAPEVVYLREHYRTIPFPFSPVDKSDPRGTGPFEFECPVQVTLFDLLTGLRSWSAVQTAIDAGRDVLDQNQENLFADAWGSSPHTPLTMKCSLYARIGTV